MSACLCTSTGIGGWNEEIKSCTGPPKQHWSTGTIVLYTTRYNGTGVLRVLATSRSKSDSLHCILDGNETPRHSSQRQKSEMCSALHVRVTVPNLMKEQNESQQRTLKKKLK